MSRNTVARKIKSFGIYKEKVKARPNLKTDFFKNIDSKEKAYWLGFLYADGYVLPNNARLSLDLSKKDYKQLEKFCDAVGANKNKIKDRVHSCGSKSVSIKINSKEFVEYIIRGGCVNAKSKKINLPEFNSECLNLAFVSGYYDGDGGADSSELYCGCRDFLEQIKNKYNIEFEIKKKDTLFVLCLGAEFKRKIIRNYPECMERKKILFLEISVTN